MVTINHYSVQLRSDSWQYPTCARGPDLLTTLLPPLVWKTTLERSTLQEDTAVDASSAIPRAPSLGEAPAVDVSIIDRVRRLRLGPSARHVATSSSLDA